MKRLLPLPKHTKRWRFRGLTEQAPLFFLSHFWRIGFLFHHRRMNWKRQQFRKRLTQSVIVNADRTFLVVRGFVHLFNALGAGVFVRSATSTPKSTLPPANRPARPFLSPPQVLFSPEIARERSLRQTRDVCSGFFVSRETALILDSAQGETRL